MAARPRGRLKNSLLWTAIAGEKPPTIPMTAREYSAAGLPWFDYYNEGAQALDGSEILKKLKSVIKLGLEKGENPLPENGSATPEKVIKLGKRLSQHQVREGMF